MTGDGSAAVVTPGQIFFGSVQKSRLMKIRKNGNLKKKHFWKIFTDPYVIGAGSVAVVTPGMLRFCATQFFKE